MTELESWLRLWHIPKVGPRTFSFLLTKFSNLNDIFTASYSDLVNLGIPAKISQAIVNHKSDGYQDDLSWLESNENNHITLINHPEYPSLLKEIPNSPPILYSTGNLELFRSNFTIAIVGGRSASSLGKKLAFSFARELADLGAIVVSGLARGIDGQAHNGALSANTRSTIAVLANGLDSVYPPEHHRLANDIANNSLLVSEFAPGVKPLARHFPRRNRIISGLSLGVLVVEAAHKSGSLITANYAIDQGREIFSIPGPINNHCNDGCHDLIQQGAKLTTCVDDILQEIAAMVELTQEHECMSCSINHQILDDQHNTLLNVIEYTPLSTEKIIEKSGLTPEQVSSMLMELEIGGHIAADAFGQYSRI